MRSLKILLMHGKPGFLPSLKFIFPQEKQGFSFSLFKAQGGRTDIKHLPAPPKRNTSVLAHLSILLEVAYLVPCPSPCSRFSLAMVRMTLRSPASLFSLQPWLASLFFQAGPEHLFFNLQTGSLRQPFINCLTLNWLPSRERNLTTIC